MLVCVSPFYNFFFVFSYFLGITPLPFVNMNRKHETKRRIEGRQKKRKDDTTQLKRGAKVCVLLKGKTLSFYYRYFTFFGVFLV